MLRVQILAALICACGVLYSSAAESRIVDPLGPTSNTVVKPGGIIASDKDSAVEVDVERYHPVEVKKPRVLEERNQRYLDGNYEYRYVLSNDVTRYEKSYWSAVANGKKVLARKGFYSHPLSNNKHITVFYTADENGYHQDSLKYTDKAPQLPKHLEVPEHEFPVGTEWPTTSTTTRKPRTTTRRTTTTTTTTTPKPTTTTRKPRTTTTRKPVMVKPSEFNWIY